MKQLYAFIFCLAITLGQVFAQNTYQLPPGETSGYTPGSFQVSDAGSATYSIGIDVPPGTAGVQPKLGLSYNSQGDNSVLGMGWQLTGLSAISRTGQTIAQDGQNRAVKYDNQDRLMLDGERLFTPITDDNIYWLSGTEYRTENNAFSRIRSIGAQGQSLTGFKVWTKDGLIMEYNQAVENQLPGATDLITTSWLLTKVSDTKGNYFTISYNLYDNARGYFEPNRIDYTGNDAAGLAPYASVRFEYENRPDTRTVNSAGMAFTSNLRRMKAIRVFYEETEVRSYILSYDLSTNPQENNTYSRIVSIQECAKVGACHTATTFDWEKKVLPSFVGYNLTSIPVGANDKIVPVDFNGDGVQDLFTILPNGTIRAYKNVKNVLNPGFEQISIANGVLIDYPTSDTRYLFGDFNADAKVDIFAYNASNGDNRLFINETSVDGAVLSFNPENNNSALQSQIGNINNKIIQAQDFNNDGRTDIFIIDLNNVSGNNYWFRSDQPSTDLAGVQFTQLNPNRIPTANLATLFQDASYEPNFIDITGDGFMDMVFTSPNTAAAGNQGSVRVIVNSGQSQPSLDTPSFTLLTGANAEVVTERNLIYATGSNGMFNFIDYNNDGLQDLFFIDKQTGTNRWFINTGVFPLSFVPPMSLDSTWFLDFDNLLPCDFNADGHLDFITIKNSTAVNKWYVGSGGAVFTYRPDFEIAPAEVLNYDIATYGNFTGTTAFDILFLRKNVQVPLKLFINQQSKQNFIKKITCGSGQEININYEYLTDDSFFTKSQNSVYPMLDHQATQLAVKSFQTNDGRGSYRQSSYRYEGAKIHVTGRGFRGFSKVEVIDDLTGIVQIREYETGLDSWKFVNAPLKRSITKLANGVEINITEYENDVKGLYPQSNPVSPYRSYFAYTKKTTSRDYEGSGEAVGELVDQQITTAEYDDLGNVTWQVQDYGDGFKDSLVNLYGNVIDNNRWHLSRLQQSTLYRFAPFQNTIVRKSAFTYDPQSGLLIREETEPGTSDTIKLVKEYIYDAFGNILSSKVIGWNGYEIEERVTTSVYDAPGRFAISNTNPLGHQTATSYDPTYGHPESETSPNGLTMQSTYDNFGRRVRVDMPDGNWQTMDYRKCGTGIDCPPNAYHLIYQQASNDPPSVIYYDLYNRELRTATKGFDNQWIFVDTEYNNLGQVVSKTQPYFEGSTLVLDTTFVYDIGGRRIKVISPGGRVDSVSYVGRETRIYNALGQEKRLIRDAKQQLTQSYDNSNNVIDYVYDAAGRMTMMVVEGNVTTMEYDIYGNKTKLIDPDIGTYEYVTNRFGQITKQTNPNGEIQTVRFDKLDRPLTRTDVEGVTQFVYDTQPHGIGKIASVSDYNGYSELRAYDELTRKISETQVIQGETYVQQYSYYPNSRIKEIIYPTGFKVLHQYNAQGYLASIVNAQNTTQEFWTAQAMNATGQFLHQRFGNGLDIFKTYNEFDYLPENILTENNGAILQNDSYGFDAIGNLQFRKDLRQNIQENFSYDNLNRLISVSLLDSLSNETETLQVEYDLLGNITSKSDVGTYHYGETNNGPRRLQSIDLITNQCIPSYNLNIQYYSFEKTKQIEKDTARLEITYGPSRQRNVQKLFISDALVRTKHYINSFFEKEITDNSIRNIHYIRGPENTIAVYTTNDQNQQSLVYLHRDHLGSVTLITNDIGGVVSRHSYDAWGKRRNANWTATADTDTLAADRGFTGHEHYDLFDLIDMNGRIYDPVIGRFTSPDPFIQDVTNIQSLNRYSYVLNNPLSFTDPSGFIWEKIKSLFTAGLSFINPVYLIGNLVFSQESYLAHVREVSTKWVKENWKTLVVIAVTITAAALTGGTALGLTGVWSTIASGAISGFAGGLTGSLLAGNNIGDALKAGLKSAAIRGATAAATFYIGDFAEIARNSTGSELAEIGVKTVGHGIVQGGSTVLQGGRFEHGLISGAISGATENFVGRLDNSAARIASSTVIGGTTSHLSGGSFANGAITGAFVMLYNNDMHQKLVKTVSDMDKSSAIFVVGVGVAALATAPAVALFGSVVALYGATTYYIHNESYIEQTKIIVP